ncbi:eCIS core domain-containing protein [Haliangium sp.]|uniref:eCIS core domain-containing protein n=1 Tax=Haliangium sp. TaxID=2663208 RepID=UPI003D0AB19E
MRPDQYDVIVQRTAAGNVQLGALPVDGSTNAKAESKHVHQAAEAGVRGGGGALPHLERIQRSFGPEHDVRHIKAHVGGAAAEASEAIGASAYATGDRVGFRSAPDLHTAAHEAAHVIQQQQGVRLQAGVGQVGDSYERHADVVADRVVAGQSAAELLTGGPTGAGRTVSASAWEGSGNADYRADVTSFVVQRKCDACESGDASAQCEGTASPSDPAASEAEEGSTAVARPNLPPEIQEEIDGLLERAASRPSEEDLRQIGQKAAHMLGPRRVAAIAREAGVPGADRREREATEAGGSDAAVQSKNPGSLVQRQAGEAAAGVAATMWWLTLVDGPLPIGDIVYGALIVGAALTVAHSATSRRAPSRTRTRTRTRRRRTSGNCMEMATACMLTSLADLPGSVFGQSRCAMCAEVCRRNGGVWPTRAPTTTGFVRCDFWNFRSTQ